MSPPVAGSGAVPSTKPSAAVVQRRHRRNSTASLPKTRTQCGAVCCTFYRSAALSAVLSTAPTIAPSVHRTTSRSASCTVGRFVGCATSCAVICTVNRVVSCVADLLWRHAVSRAVSCTGCCDDKRCGSVSRTGHAISHVASCTATMPSAVSPTAPSAALSAVLSATPTQRCRWSHR